MENKKLIEIARKAIKNAYTPISEFPIGSAVLTDRDNIYSGCNVESVISGMGTCAERCAIDNAVSHGEYCFKAIAITSKLEEPIKPCGMCLQYIAEFSQIANHNIKIIMAGSKGKIKRSSINKMLPGSFGPRDLGKNLDRYKYKK